MTRKLSISLFAFLFVLSLVAMAQELPTAKPEAVGLSSERLERIGKAVQKSIDDKRIAGAVTLVVRHGQVAYFKAQGMQDREAGKPMRPDTIFRICSMSKPITSAAVMMLYEEGKFLLEDPVSKYLPAFKNPKVLVKPVGGGARYSIPAAREITIRDLLRHTSGLTYQWNGDLGPLYEKAGVEHGLAPSEITIGENVDRLAKQPLLFSPGERWEYSLSVDVLGRLVEVVSGKTFDEFLRARLFEPLGMKDTYFFPPENKLDRLATAYTYYEDKGLNLGNVRILSRKSVELMTHDQLGKIAPDQGFGLGFGVDGVKAPLTELGSAGSFNWSGFFYTAFIADPKEQMVIVFMGQLHPAGDLTLDRQVEELAYQAIID
jgi:CubicO group peptidase (beta-lactamase class C family)